jgi:alpha-galactosidase
MQTLLQLHDLQIAIQADSCQRVPQGFLLRGQRVVLLHPFGETLCYRHGWHSWSLSCWLPLSKALPAPLVEKLWPQIDHPDMLTDYPFTSSSVSALQAPDGQILLLGALQLDAQIKADTESLRGVYDAQVSTELEWFLGFGPERIVFDDYANILAQRLGIRGQDQPQRVWCSWYSLFREISEENLDDIFPGLDG